MPRSTNVANSSSAGRDCDDNDIPEATGASSGLQDSVHSSNDSSDEPQDPPPARSQRGDIFRTAPASWVPGRQTASTPLRGSSGRGSAPTSPAATGGLRVTWSSDQSRRRPRSEHEPERQPAPRHPTDSYSLSVQRQILPPASSNEEDDSVPPTYLPGGGVDARSSFSVCDNYYTYGKKRMNPTVDEGAVVVTDNLLHLPPTTWFSVSTPSNSCGVYLASRSNALGSCSSLGTFRCPASGSLPLAFRLFCTNGRRVRSRSRQFGYCLCFSRLVPRIYSFVLNADCSNTNGHKSFRLCHVTVCALEINCYHHPFDTVLACPR
jgi:hypothetical protein